MEPQRKLSKIEIVINNNTNFNRYNISEVLRMKKMKIERSENLESFCISYKFK